MFFAGGAANVAISSATVSSNTALKSGGALAFTRTQATVALANVAVTGNTANNVTGTGKII